jgi:hypothetical protein
MKKNTEAVDDQIDRLNSALHMMLHQVRCETPGHRAPSRMSIAPSEIWQDTSSSDGHLEDFELVHARLETLLQENDRLMMVVEDFLSVDCQSRATFTLTSSQLSSLLEGLLSLKNKTTSEFHYIVPSSSGYLQSDLVHFKLKPSPSDHLSSEASLEEALKESGSATSLSEHSNPDEPCPSCGIDASKLRKEVKLELQGDFIRAKSAAIEKERSNFEAQFEELEKMKSMYQKKLKDQETKQKHFDKQRTDLEKQELDLARRRSQFEKKKHDWETRVIRNDEGHLQDETFSPSKLSREELEKQLKELKGKLEQGPDSKITMRVNQIENQLTRLRTEKLLSECNNKTSLVVSNLVKAIDKEKTQDENKRRQMLDRTVKNYRVQRVKDDKNFDKKWEILTRKEKELADKEKFLQSTWAKVPNSENLIPVIQETLEHLGQVRVDYENSQLLLLNEKKDLRKVLEKFKDLVLTFESSKTHNRDSMEKIKEYLNSITLEV